MYGTHVIFITSSLLELGLGAERQSNHRRNNKQKQQKGCHSLIVKRYLITKKLLLLLFFVFDNIAGLLNNSNCYKKHLYWTVLVYIHKAS